MARMFWQRCPRCGRLTLSRLGATTVCDCSRDIPGPAGRPQSAAPLASGVTPALPVSTPIPVPPPAPALALLTPEQDAAARRLLASVFPNGFDF